MILAIDIEGFGSPARSDLTRAWLRHRLRQFVNDALVGADVKQGQVLLHSDLGDGLLVLLDPALSLGRLLSRGLGVLASRLAHYNVTSATPSGRLRLRLAVHYGPVVRDAYGYTGHALNHAFRLLDAEVIKAALAGCGAVAVAVLSDSARRLVPNDLPTDSWIGWQPVWVANKETTALAWLHMPGERVQPRLDGLLRAADTRVSIPTDVREDVVRRRELLAFSGTLLGSASLERLLGKQRLSVEDALVAQAVSRRLHRLDESLHVTRVDASRSRHATAVHRLARRSGKRTVRAGFLRALAHIEAVGGAMAAADLRNHAMAGNRFRRALQAAAEVGDPALSGMVCLRMSEAALAADRFGEALELAHAGRHLVGEGDPALHATLWLAVANAHVAAGSPAEALHAVDLGAELVSRGSLPRSPWTRVDASRFSGGRGMVEASLGRWEDAEHSLRAGIAAYPPGNGLRGVLLAHLSGVRFAQEDPEQAASLAAEALTIALRLGSPSRLAALRPVWPHLRRYERIPAVTELRSSLQRATRLLGSAGSGTDLIKP